MGLEIRKYDQELDYQNLIKLIRSEGQEWKDYLTPVYQNALKNSITYVALLEGKLCGYSRSMDDNGMFIWVIDLLVNKSHRGQSIGRKLMECILDDFPGIDTFVMSDVDTYYEKLGYSKEGSIFKVKYPNDKT